MPEQDAAEPQQPKVKLLRPAEFAAHFGEEPVDVQRVYGWIRRGYLRAIRVGTIWIPETELARLQIEGLPPSRPTRATRAPSAGGAAQVAQAPPTLAQ